jgi:hypothetical protein
METKSMTSGSKPLDMELPASQSEKPSPYVVNTPLSPSRLSWLRQQQKSAHAEFDRIFAEMDAAKVAAE